MISAKKSNGVKNITNNMYKKQIIFVEIDKKHEKSKEKKMVVSYSYNIL
jgi:plasmid replication initiation protein